MSTQSDAPRSIITRTPRGLDIGIPSKSNWFVVGFLAFWCCGWLAGEVFAIAAIFGGLGGGFGTGFLFLWLSIWTFGGFFAIRTLFWQAFGRELISIEGKTFSYQRMILGFGKNREFDIRKMKDIAVHDKSKQTNTQTGSTTYRKTNTIPFGMKSGKIGFTYNAKKHYFATEVDHSEATQLVQVLQDSANFDEDNFKQVANS